ncbi:MAG: DUF1566 domain-containing protein, partial [Methylovulum sp.]|nr:DUF1566 domain-containing protein [Methylovulum sp.]
AWTQLMLDNDPNTQWAFVKGKGVVSAVASNLGATEFLKLSSLLRFENLVIAMGKVYQGGTIFYIDPTGKHGLVAALTDQSTSMPWLPGYAQTGAIATAVGAGLANTNDIISTWVNNGGDNSAYAAVLCANLQLGGYGGWFLPSKDELALMYQNIGPGAAAPFTNVGGFTTGVYWSSSEDNEINLDYFKAWVQDFGNGDQYPDDKATKYHVRAVRAF